MCGDFDEGIIVYLEEEVKAENRDENCHCEGRNDQQKFSSEFVHDEGGRNCRRHLDDANDDAAEAGLE